MKNLRKLREACNYTQEELAKMLDTTQQTVARWEAGKAEPNLAALRDLAMIFETSVDDLMGANPFSRSVATTLMTSLDGGEGHFWGHLGVQLPGSGPTHWYPVSVEAADLAANAISAVESEDGGWAVIPTLNNRLLMLHIDRVRSISLRAEEASQDPDDWELGWDSGSGLPLELYRALAYSVIGGPNEASERFRQTVEDIVKEQGLTPELIMDRVVLTHIHFPDGGSKRLFPDDLNLWTLVGQLHSDPPRVFDLSNEEEDVNYFIPAASVAMIDAPLCLVMDAVRDLEEELKAEEARVAAEKPKSSGSAKPRRRSPTKSGSRKTRAT